MSAIRPAAARSRAISAATARARRQGRAGRRSAADHGQDRQPIPAACRSRCSTDPRRLAANRAQFYKDVPSRSTATTGRARRSRRACIDHWWLQGMMGRAKAHYECIKAFSETDFTEDLKKIDVPTLILHGDDDQIVPYTDARRAFGQAGPEADAQSLPRLSAWHADGECRCTECRPAGLHQVMTDAAALIARLGAHTPSRGRLVSRDLPPARARNRSRAGTAILFLLEKGSARTGTVSTRRSCGYGMREARWR